MSDDTQRLEATVKYGDGKDERYWFDLPAKWNATTSGNPWFALLLPLAATVGGEFTVDAPVDPYLLHNAQSLLRLWEVWHPGKTRRVKLNVETQAIVDRPERVLSAFTGGIDAYFTVLRHPECRHYVNVLGFDMPLKNRPSYERLLSRLASVASQLEAEMIPLAANFRETRWGQLPWETFSSGAALAGTFLVLEREFQRVLIPSSFDLRTLFPWGTHPLSDPLYSTSKFQVIHEGASHSRVDKTIAIIDNRTVRETLHVCFQGSDSRGQDDTNCSRCSKCYRTMIVLDILGVLEKCRLFDKSFYDVKKIGNLDTGSPVARSFFEDIRLLAMEKGRVDIAREIERSYRRSRAISRFDFLGKKRFLWRIPVYLRRRAFGNVPVLDRA